VIIQETVQDIVIIQETIQDIVIDHVLKIVQETVQGLVMAQETVHVHVLEMEHAPKNLQVFHIETKLNLLHFFILTSNFSRE
jgi:hypothetical protein